MTAAPRLILHIGQGKTGSTSIQNALRNNPETLARHGVFFPETGRHTNHQDIFTYLTGDVKHHDPALGGARDDARKTALGKEYWEAARRHIAEATPELVVLSCENQFRPFSAEALTRLSRELEGMFSEILVTAYLRDPADHFLSMAQQDVKKRPDITIPGETALRDVLEPWLMHGPGPVEVIRFARDTLQDGDVVADFCARYLPFAAGDLSIPANRDNTTISAEAMALLQAYHRGEIAPPSRYHAARAQRMKELIQAADAAEPGFSKPRLAEGLKAAIEARAQDLGWLEEQFGLSFPGLDPTAMPREAARERIAGIDAVADICAVDEARKDALLRRVQAAGAQKRGLGERLFAAFRPRQDAKSG